ncbi:hypothetical protein BG004_003724 [Podila humilis]|nr:hypothetical protein BG004_003724 [Podila humilis]
MPLSMPGPHPYHRPPQPPSWRDPVEYNRQMPGVGYPYEAPFNEWGGTQRYPDKQHHYDAHPHLYTSAPPLLGSLGGHERFDNAHFHDRHRSYHSYDPIYLQHPYLAAAGSGRPIASRHGSHDAYSSQHLREEDVARMEDQRKDPQVQARLSSPTDQESQSQQQHSQQPQDSSENYAQELHPEYPQLQQHEQHKLSQQQLWHQQEQDSIRLGNSRPRRGLLSESELRLPHTRQHSIELVESSGRNASMSKDNLMRRHSSAQTRHHKPQQDLRHSQQPTPQALQYPPRQLHPSPSNSNLVPEWYRVSFHQQDSPHPMYGQEFQRGRPLAQSHSIGDEPGPAPGSARDTSFSPKTEHIIENRQSAAPTPLASSDDVFSQDSFKKADELPLGHAQGASEPPRDHTTSPSDPSESHTIPRQDQNDSGRQPVPGLSFATRTAPLMPGSGIHGIAQDDEPIHERTGSSTSSRKRKIGFEAQSSARIIAASPEFQGRDGYQQSCATEVDDQANAPLRRRSLRRSSESDLGPLPRNHKSMARVMASSPDQVNDKSQSQPFEANNAQSPPSGQRPSDGHSSPCTVPQQQLRQLRAEVERPESKMGTMTTGGTVAAPALLDRSSSLPPSASALLQQRRNTQDRPMVIGKEGYYRQEDLEALYAKWIIEYKREKLYQSKKQNRNLIRNSLRSSKSNNNQKNRHCRPKRDGYRRQLPHRGVKEKKPDDGEDDDGLKERHRRPSLSNHERSARRKSISQGKQKATEDADMGRDDDGDDGGGFSSEDEASVGENDELGESGSLSNGYDIDDDDDDDDDDNDDEGDWDGDGDEVNVSDEDGEAQDGRGRGVRSLTRRSSKVEDGIQPRRHERLHLIKAMRHHHTHASRSQSQPMTVPEEKKDGKKHECQTCGKRFSRPSQLSTHSLTHTGERPYICTLCSRNFNVASNLKRHMRTHEGQANGSDAMNPTEHKNHIVTIPLPLSYLSSLAPGVLNNATSSVAATNNIITSSLLSTSSSMYSPTIAAVNPTPTTATIPQKQCQS